jgi:hypothetical protein
MGVDMAGPKPIGQLFIIHPELHQPVENEKKDDQENQYSHQYSKKDATDFCNHTVEITDIPQSDAKIKQIAFLHPFIYRYEG